MTLEQLHAHARLVGEELARTIAAIETALAADAYQAQVLMHAATRLTECRMWIEQAVASTATADAPRIIKPTQ